VQLIRDNPGKYAFAGPGVGSTPHLGAANYSGWRLSSIWCTCPSPGLRRRSRRPSAGIRRIAFTALPPALSAVQSGATAARLALPSTSAPPASPIVPTFAEQGIMIRTPIRSRQSSRRQNAEGNHRLAVSRDCRDRRAACVKEAPHVARFRAGLLNTPDQFAARIKLEIEKWGKVVHDAKLRIE